MSFQPADKAELVTAVTGWCNGDTTTNPNIGSWDTSLITDMKELFKGKSSFNDDISNWNVSNVLSMGWMFHGASAFNKPLNSWVVSKVTTMDYMFYASAFNQPINTQEVTVDGSTYTAWNVSSVNNMKGMFGDSNFNQDISGWDVSNVTNLSYMFYAASIFDQDIRGWDVSNGPNFDSMFNNANAFKATYGPNVPDTPTVQYFPYNGNQPTTGDVLITGTSELDGVLTADASSLADANGPFPLTGITYQWNRDAVAITDANGINETGITYTLTAADAGKVITVTASYQDNSTPPESESNTSAGTTYFTPITQANIQTAVDLWCDPNTAAAALTTYGEINTWDTSAVTDMSSIFNGKTSFNDDISGWNVSLVNNMDSMFRNAPAFNNGQTNNEGTAPLNWDVSEVTNMQIMFYEATTFNQPLRNVANDGPWDVSKVTNMNFMFFQAQAFAQPIGSWNVSNVTTMTNMFYYANAFKDAFYPNVPDTPTVQYFPYNGNQATTGNVLITGTSELGGLLTASNDLADANGPFPLTGITYQWNRDAVAITDANGNTYILTAADAGKVITVTASYQDNSTPPESESNTSAGTTPFSSITPITDRDSLVTAVGLWINDNAAALTTYGEINTWDTSGVTDMSNLFNGKTTFNDDISGWNVSLVTNMSSMFQDCFIFDKNISNWDVSNVTNMQNIFQYAKVFNQPIGNWDVSKVTNMYNMFKRAWKFNQDIGTKPNVTMNGSTYTAWDVSKVTQISSMFNQAFDFNQDISGWDVSSVTYMSYMFSNAGAFNQDLSSWDTSAVTDMIFMFQGATAFKDTYGPNVPDTPTVQYFPYNGNQPTTGDVFITFNGTAAEEGTELTADASSLADANGPFPLTGITYQWNRDAVAITDANGNTYILTAADAGKVITVTASYQDNSTPPESESNTSAGTTPFGSFTPITDRDSLVTAVGLWCDPNTAAAALTTYGEINTWDTSAVTDMKELFNNKSSFNDDISSWDTSIVTNMKKMFHGASAFNKNIGSWNTGLVTDISQMFKNCSVFNQDISSWDTSKVNDMEYMFNNAQAFNQDINTSGNSWNTGNVTRMQYMFSGATAFNGDISGWDVSNVEYMYQMFNGASNFNQDIGGWNTISSTSFLKMFVNCSEFNQDISKWNTSNVTTIKEMFRGCSKFNQDIGTKLVTMNNLTYNAFDVSSVTNMQGIFHGATIFNNGQTTINAVGTNPLNWDVSSVTTMEEMFNNNYDFNQSLRNVANDGPWDVSSVTNMHKMFRLNRTFNNGASGSSPDVVPLYWDVSKVTNLGEMFHEARVFNQPLRNVADDGPWDVSSVTNMSAMFAGGWGQFNQDISAWNTSNVEKMNTMFRFNSKFNADIRSWNVSSGTNFSNMFQAASAFKLVYPNAADTPTVRYFPYNGNQATTGDVLITGTSDLGEVLTASNTLADANGPFPLAGISYQWNRDAVAIVDATVNTYTLTAADGGKVITVTASYQDGSTPPVSESNTSAGTTPFSSSGLTITGTGTNTIVMTIDGNYTGSFADAKTTSGWDPDTQNLTIIGNEANSASTWTDFQFSYIIDGKPDYLHIENITFFTDSVDGYAVYSRDTKTTMKDVTIDGYSFRAIDTSPGGIHENSSYTGTNKTMETGGGAMRIRAATYVGHSASNPTLVDVTVQNCCRGFRIQDTVGAYVKNCHCVKATGATYSVSDNSFYFAAGSYTSADGCNGCTFDTCDATDVGQTGFQNIGGIAGSNNSFINCSIDGSIGAGFSCYNTKGTVNVTGCTFTNANTHAVGETSGWGGAVDNYGGAACGMSVAVGDTSAIVNVSGCSFVSGGSIIYYVSGPGTMNRTTTNNYHGLSGFPNGLGVGFLSHSTAGGNYKVITVNGDYTGTLQAALAAIPAPAWNPATNSLKIVGYTTATAVWNDFQFIYDANDAGRPANLHLENITFSTASVDGYAVYSRDTKTTMKDVTIDGYSNRTVDRNIAPWKDDTYYTVTKPTHTMETKGGAMRIRAATYTGHDTNTPTLSNVTVTNCCRGIRIQDSTGAYVKGCSVTDVTDNAIYFAAGSYTSADGCTDCIANACTVTRAGQVAFMSIGGEDNEFLNCTMDTSTGSGFGCFNAAGIIKVTGCSFTNANTAVAGETNGWGGSVDNFSGAACGVSVAVTDYTANVIVYDCTFVSGGDIVYSKVGAGAMTTTSNTVTLSAFTGGLGSWLSYSTDNNFKVITVNGNYSGETFTNALPLTNGTFTTSTDNDLKIIGSGSGVVWNDFQFSYSDGKPEYLHIENITFFTASVDGYAVYSKVTKTTMKDVTFTGYSGGPGRETETAGGAMRIRAADYSGENHDSGNPTLQGVTVTNCCRGIRIQDSTSAYVYACAVTNVTDNAIYFAAGSYTSADGCIDCIADTCTVETAGQVAFMNIGGSGNKFINSSMNANGLGEGSRGAAVGVYNTNGRIEVINCNFTKANTSHTTTPWGAATDDFSGAACGLSVQSGDTSGYLYIEGCNFISGYDSVFWKEEHGSMELLNNTVPANIGTADYFPNGLIDPDTSYVNFYFFKPALKADLVTAVTGWCGDAAAKAAALNTYGNISYWNTSQIENMSQLFKDKTSFNDDISGWDVSNVTNMDQMFFLATVFNSDISGWVVSKVTTMYGMFYKATVFNSDISGWDVSKVDNMAQMFAYANAFNADISSWDVSAVTAMMEMFMHAYAFNQDISGWDVSAVTTMRKMFVATHSFNQYIRIWQTPALTGSDYMWNTENDTHNVEMLNIYGNGAGDADISETNTSFGHNGSLGFVNVSLTISGNEVIPTYHVTPTEETNVLTATLTSNAGSGITYQWKRDGSDIAGETAETYTLVPDDVGKVITVEANYTDKYSGEPRSLTVDTSAIISNAGPTGTVTISGTATQSQVLTAANDLADTNGLGAITYQWNRDNVNIAGEIATTYTLVQADVGSTITVTASYTDDQGTAESKTSSATSAVVFRPAIKSELQTAVNLWVSYNASALATYGNISGWDTSLITDMSELFKNKNTFNDDISGWDVSSVTNMRYMFKNAYKFNQDIGKKSITAANSSTGIAYTAWDVSKVTDMKEMFRQCLEFDKNISNWDVSSVTNMYYMFRNAEVFNQPISGWDVSKVTNMESIFTSAQAFNQPIGDWNVSKVTTMHAMFFNAPAFNNGQTNNEGTAPLNWDVSSVTTMRNMFYGASVFNQDIGSWDVSEVTTMQDTFHSAQAFNQPIGSWNVSKVTNMVAMFYSCSVFNQNIGDWDTSSVTGMHHMFYRCLDFNQNIGTKSITAANSSTNIAYTAWDTSEVTNMYSMFTSEDNIMNFNNGDDSGVSNTPLNWNTSKVTNMNAMFRGCEKFNQYITNFDVTSVSNMGSMFNKAKVFDQNIREWTARTPSPSMSWIFGGANALFERFDGVNGFGTGNSATAVFFSTSAPTFTDAPVNMDIVERDLTIFGKVDDTVSTFVTAAKSTIVLKEGGVTSTKFEAVRQADEKTYKIKHLSDTTPPGTYTLTAVANHDASIAITGDTSVTSSAFTVEVINEPVTLTITYDNIKLLHSNLTDDNAHTEPTLATVTLSESNATAVVTEASVIIPSITYQLLDASAHWKAQVGGNCYIQTDLGGNFPYGHGYIGVKTNGDGTSAGGSVIINRAWNHFLSNDGGNKRWSDIVPENRFNYQNFANTFKLLHFEYIGADKLQLKIRKLTSSDGAYAALSAAEQTAADALDLSIYEFYYKTNTGSNDIYTSSTAATIGTDVKDSLQLVGPIGGPYNLQVKSGPEFHDPIFAQFIPGNANSLSVTVTATDAGANVTPTASTTILAQNDVVPSFTSNAIEAANEDSLYTYNMIVSSVYSGAATITAETKPTWLTLSTTTTSSYQLLDASAHWKAQVGGNCYIQTDLGGNFPYGHGYIGVKTNGDGTSAGGSVIINRAWNNFLSNDGGNKRWSDIVPENRFNYQNFANTFKLLHFEYIGADLLQLKIRALTSSDGAYAALSAAEQTAADALDLSIYEFYYKTTGNGSNDIYTSSTDVTLYTASLSGTPLQANVGTNNNDVTLKATDAYGGVKLQGFTITVANVNDASTGYVDISGSTKQGYDLTASNALGDEDGMGAITYQWKRNGMNIGDATAETAYSLVQDDVGKVITVTASYTDGHGTVTNVTSDPTDNIQSSSASFTKSRKNIKSRNIPAATASGKRVFTQSDDIPYTAVGAMTKVEKRSLVRSNVRAMLEQHKSELGGEKMYIEKSLMTFANMSSRVTKIALHDAKESSHEVPLAVDLSSVLKDEGFYIDLKEGNSVTLTFSEDIVTIKQSGADNFLVTINSEAEVAMVAGDSISLSSANQLLTLGSVSGGPNAPTIYVSNCNAEAVMGQEAEFEGGNTTQEYVNSTTISTNILLSAVKDTFKFYTDAANGQNVGNDSLTANFTGVGKTLADIWDTSGDPLILARTEMLGLLAGEVFGHEEASDLFSNHGDLITSFNTAANVCDESVGTHATSAASVELINGLLADSAGIDRFELAYNALLTGAGNPPVGVNTVYATPGDATTESMGIVVKKGGVETGAKVEVEIRVAIVDTVLVYSVDRLTVKHDATTPVAAGDVVTINLGLTSDVSIAINSVQAAMLNGTLDDVAGTSAPLEVGDAIRIKYTINGKTGQLNASGDVVDVVFTAFVDFTCT